ncbi:ISLre2 family transposase [Clostridiisalibacter paucivorans]|uniref:ISLre2 family transposase n=1 Tax=Clostridiisalibacter paucivorans TaxID=408753 RepID=UPI000AFA91DD|nr:ISLre2 family transposase [Clostridiisalibacter paucivorans]
METIIHEISQKIINETKENLINTLANHKDISEFILNTEKILDDIGVQIVQKALETVDSLVKQDNLRKEKWTVQRKADRKTIATIFGEVNYKRTYYKNKKTGEYKYLSDQRLGIDIHDRLDSSLKAKLVDEAIESSYRKSGQIAVDSIDLTNQTVMNTIRELGDIPNDSVKITEKKKVVKTLYIEADEDHVALQSGKNIEPKLVYVHEGKKAVNKDRYRLQNVRYFSGVYSHSADLWIEVANYLEEAYDMEKIEKIYLSGDGAKWIKNGVGWIKGSIFVLDRFHLSKYIKIATAHLPYTTPIMWHYINKLDKKSVLDLFRVIIEETKLQTKINAIKDSRRYIMNQWEGIKNQYNKDYIGCSAEGHISHILADRLSSRPRAWSKTGVDQMSRLRVFKANGGDVYDLIINK